ncbi:hypothetical protein BV25DRAFT_1829262 [Artomyces pyxidatus]|uniref:Uncharacterized protein n=1 Tax=Artomyces pyxidatus TaxID=48021 RepID=A0ACB8STU3_9AGAM|nr:hypothetical protein BV25DRAFT_1829262 [Artomyces pyxidatus]
MHPLLSCTLLSLCLASRVRSFLPTARPTRSVSSARRGQPAHSSACPSSSNRPSHAHGPLASSEAHPGSEPKDEGEGSVQDEEGYHLIQAVHDCTTHLPLRDRYPSPSNLASMFFDR